MMQTLDQGIDKPIQLIEQLHQQGRLRALDVALCRYIVDAATETDAAVLLAIALTSERNGHGDVCLDVVSSVAALEVFTAPDLIPLNRWIESIHSIQASEWWVRLSQSDAIQCVSDTSDMAAKNTSPLVLAGTGLRPQLYLRRYWDYEQRVRQALTERVEILHEPPKALLKKVLAALFTSSKKGEAIDWQKMACALSARRHFAVITGGPGTGKTTTVVKLLALLQTLALQQNIPLLKIALAAPTGKAAARLNASIAAQVNTLPFDALSSSQFADDLKNAIPTEVTTLHRLLGPKPDSRHFRHHALNPLPMDLVVVDEASMVDLEMLAALVDALKPSARLILLGDKDQLASVEAGAILGDLCQQAVHGDYRHETAAWLAEVTGDELPDQYVSEQGRELDQAITMLRYSHRFSAEGGIGALAHLVNHGEYRGQVVANPVAALIQLFDQQPEQLERLNVATANDATLAEWIVRGYRGYLDVLTSKRPSPEADCFAFDQWALTLLQAHTAFQVLCAVREGAWGVHQLNQWIKQILAKAGLLKGSEAIWFEGRPILITKNDYGLRLMNGDIGIALMRPVVQLDGSLTDTLRVVFPTAEGGVRWVMPSRLQSFETVFAMTVHKSQGSEFTHTTLILPDQPNAVLTQELIYTGITRSRERFTLVYSRESVLKHALTNRVSRLSGLSFS